MNKPNKNRRCFDGVSKPIWAPINAPTTPGSANTKPSLIFTCPTFLWCIRLVKALVATESADVPSATCGSTPITFQ